MPLSSMLDDWSKPPFRQFNEYILTLKPRRCKFSKYFYVFFWEMEGGYPVFPAWRCEVSGGKLTLTNETSHKSPKYFLGSSTKWEGSLSTMGFKKIIKSHFHWFTFICTLAKKFFIQPPKGGPLNSSTKGGSASGIHQHTAIEEWILESNSDCYGKDLLFVALLAFCVINFEPIMI